jgi:hypothetical protein
MGMSVEEFNKEAEKSPEIFDELFDAVARFSKNTFAGTSQKMATSVKGLKSTLSDIFVIGARNFWRPLVEAVTPMASEILSRLSDLVLGGDMAAIGQSLADMLLSGLQRAKALFNLAKTFGLEAAIAKFQQMIVMAWPGIQKSLMVWANNFWNFMADIVIPATLITFSALFSLVDQLIIDNWPFIQESLMTWANRFWNFITDTVMPGALIAFGTLANFIGQLIADNWPVVQAQLFLWRDQFFGWLVQLYSQIPTVIGTLVELISTFLADNWPLIASKLLQWSTQFWDWVDIAIAGAGTTLNALIIAVAAWALGEGSAQMLSFGNILGQMLMDGLAITLAARPRVTESDWWYYRGWHT